MKTKIQSKEATCLVLSCLVLPFFITGSASADVLELKDGSVLNGDYKGGTQGTLRFQVGGELKVVPVADILALSFTGKKTTSSTPVAPAATNKTAATAAGESKSVVVGTTMLVRTSELVGTKNMSKGQRFSAKLEGKLMAGSKMIAPNGAIVYGRVLKSKRGGIGRRKAELELTLTEVMIDGQLKAIKTSVLGGKGGSGAAGGKMVKGAAVGALVDGSSGAKSGAKVGLGFAILGGGGRHAEIKPGTLIEFQLVEAINF